MYSVPPPDPDALHEALYEGAIVRFGDLPAMRDIVAYARAFLADQLGSQDPVRIHEAFDRQALAQTLSDVQRAFANAPEAKRLWRALLEELGFDPRDMARDRLILRFQPPIPPDGDPHHARSTATVGFHRDSWGSNLYAQVNWWAPIYPITAGRTFAFLPDHFAKVIPNDSAQFDLAELMAHNRAAPAQAPRKPMTPRPLDPVDPALGQPVVIDPGEVIAFSAQHAHVGVPNRTGLTRISLDTRTLRLSDQRAGRGARNVDGRALWTAYGMFRRVSDGAPLPDVLQVPQLEPFRHDL
ncbi:hypothetical protein [Sphingobium nicotianae]|uniref:Phytanoyl-CoA dioxygenase n=1 Tax=Sphingobium nicotianae TaxID=2782607 RepID=A0A9X1DAN4_9SPHN|nr:hypothetical protein [Sphingobium nicotianae]MBT2186440.1 hypothetical protein [Sphingobium nicotianae]